MLSPLALEVHVSCWILTNCCWSSYSDGIRSCCRHRVSLNLIACMSRVITHRMTQLLACVVASEHPRPQLMHMSSFLDSCAAAWTGNLVGLLIGPRGGTITRIQSESGAQVEVVRGGAGGSDASSHAVRVRGIPRSVAACQVLIEQLYRHPAALKLSECKLAS